MKTQYRIIERLGTDGKKYYEIEMRGGLPWALAWLCFDWDIVEIAFNEESARERMRQLACADAYPARVIAQT